MRTSRTGLIVGYALLLAVLLLIVVVRRFFPAFGELGGILILALIIFLCGALALAVFSGSVVCALGSMLRDPTSRSLGGYLTLCLSAVSALAVGAAYFRMFVFGR
jgi:hypothetical protein